MKSIVKFTLILIGVTFLSCQKEAQISTAMDENFYLSNDGSDMPVFVRGNGASKVFILLLHGGPGDGSLKYANHTFSNALEEDYAMVYWDQRHQGNSHGHYKKDDVTIDKMVEDTYLLIKTLKKRYGEDISLFLMGHSWGGTLGTAFMIHDDYQKEVNGWIESGGAHDFPFMNRALVKKFKETATLEIASGNNIEEWTEILDYANTIDTNNITNSQASELNSYAGQAEKLITTLATKTSSELSGFSNLFLTPNNPFTTNINALQFPESFFEEILTNSSINDLHKIVTPTLLLWGRYDFKVPVALGIRTLEEINTTDKFLKIYEQSGHSSMRYQPLDFVNDVKQFINTYK